MVNAVRTLLAALRVGVVDVDRYCHGLASCQSLPGKLGNVVGNPCSVAGDLFDVCAAKYSAEGSSDRVIAGLVLLAMLKQALEFTKLRLIVGSDGPHELGSELGGKGGWHMVPGGPEIQHGTNALFTLATVSVEVWARPTHSQVVGDSCVFEEPLDLLGPVIGAPIMFSMHRLSGTKVVGQWGGSPRHH